MKDLIKEHAASITAAVTVLMIIIVIGAVTVNGATGLNNILGLSASTENSGLSNMEDMLKTTDILSGEPPEIQYNDSISKMKCGVDTDILKYFVVTMEGNTYEAKDVMTQIIRIQSSNGTEIEYDDITQTVNFQTSGIYEIKLSVRDFENRQTVAEFMFPVEAA